MFAIELERKTGERFTLHYDHRNSRLVTESGDDVMVTHGATLDFEPAQTFTPDTPLVGKSARVSKLKIQLGLKCNYSCSYCSQATHIGEAVISNVDDARAFLADLDQWLEGSPDGISLWGGEPLVYWKMVRYLVPELRQRFPYAKIGFFTNGSLLDDEKVEFIKDYDLDVSMSHDGPGQHLRGDDPLDDPVVLQSVKRLTVEHRGRFDINVVISTYTANIPSTLQWFQSRIHPEVDARFEGIVDSHGGDHDTVGAFTSEQYRDMVESVKATIHDPSLDGGFGSHVRAFVNTLYYGVKDYAQGQSCGMDQHDTLAVDLQGNVLTCHNTGSESRHKLGTVDALDAVALDTSYHWSERPDCGGCPYLHICRGACMYLTGQDWKQTCENNYHFSRAIFEASIERITQARVVGMTGYHRRPQLHNPDKIAVVTVT